MKRITKDIIIAICLISYVLILALAYTRMNIDRLSKDIEVFAGAFLVLGLLGLEKGYKIDDGKVAITAIELLVMSFYSLSITHITSLLKIEFINYMFLSAGIIGVYYLIKEIIIYTKQKKEDLKKLSDISEIVKKDEPIKKEAKKRNKEENTDSKNNKKNMDNSKNKKNPNKKTKTENKKIKKENVKTKDKKVKKSNNKNTKTKKEVK